MGQKVNPKGFRIGKIYTWNSLWFSEKNYVSFLKQDLSIRKFLLDALKEAAVEKIIIERGAGDVKINVYTAKPGVVIGRAGSGIEDLKKKIQQKFFAPKQNININIKEVERPALSSSIVMQNVIADLEKRVPFRKAIKQAIGRVERAGAPGAKIMVSGRLNGAEIARVESITYGKIPLQTIRADIDYTRGAAQTIYGKIGVKVWIYRGEIFDKAEKQAS